MNMLEALIAFLKTLPAWLATVAEILIIAIIFLTCLTFLAGIWVGLRVIGQRASMISQIEFFPPKITFINKSEEQQNG